MLFKDNPYLKNNKGLRTAGQPDLIIEVWSEGNTDRDKNFKKDLYSSSPITEHWYIEQDSNDVTCYFGTDRIKNQHLSDILVTRGGLQFDLRYLTI
jgi:Uma2 family endonuclease